MQDGAIGVLDVAGAEQQVAITKAPRQHQCEFPTAMAMFGHRLARGNSQQSDLGRRVCGWQQHLSRAPAKRSPGDRVQIPPGIGAQGHRQHRF
ncbi:hypothetical protein D3C87_1951740 [compost metagenome]